MQNTDNMGNWTYPSDEKMEEIEDLLNNEMTFNLGIKMFSEEFSIFTYDSTINAGAYFYFRYSDEFTHIVKRLLADPYAKRSNFEIEHSIRPNLFYILNHKHPYGGTSRVNNKS